MNVNNPSRYLPFHTSRSHTMTYAPSRFDRDPEALAWARAKVQAEIDRAEKFVEQATAQGATEGAEFWRRHALHLHRSFVGGEGCVMGRFDERRSALAPDAPAVPAPATDQAAPTDWIDGHPQLEAIAAAVWEQCRTEGTSLVVDDPRNIAVAALAAVLPTPAGRAAVLREAAVFVEAMNEGCGHRKPCASCDARDDAAAELCRMADEAQRGAEQGEPDARPGTTDYTLVHRHQAHADEARQPETIALKRAHVALAEQAGRDQAALTRVRTIAERAAYNVQRPAARLARRILAELPGQDACLPRCPCHPAEPAVGAQQPKEA